jgi:2,4-dienoyl-CoA reductase-like NADH-dependent reductase (Old Yellow Enzyme family)
MAGPATLLYAQEGLLSDQHVAFHRARAAGGAGLIVTEEHAVHPSGQGAFRHACGAWDPRVVAPLGRLAQAVHGEGAHALVQLYHPGLSDSGALMLDERGPLWAPSRVAGPGAAEQGLAMGRREIAELVEGFAASAGRVAAAGLDGVEVHAAHGWLVGQFLSPLFNRRGDGYGGDARGRTRLALEIGAAIRERAGGLVLGIQLSVDEHVGAAGIDPANTDAQVELLAASALFDYISLSTGSQFSTHRTIPPMVAPPSALGEHARRARAIAAGRTAIAVVGGVATLEAAAALVAGGSADLVGLTRAHLADPALVAKTRDGRAEDVVPCVAANDCLARAFAGRAVSCVLNPATGREGRWGAGAPPRAARRRRVTVVGAGPAGLRAAARAAERGHAVTVLERDETAGGHLRLLARLPGRARWADGIAWLERAARRAGAVVRLGAPADAAGVLEGGPDAILVATGASWATDGAHPGRPRMAPIPIAPTAAVVDIATALRDALEDPASLGARVAILDEDGGALALGLAEIVAAGGARVDVVSRHDVVAPAVHAALEAPDLHARLAPLDVGLWPQTVVAEVQPRALRLAEAWSGRPWAIEEVDTVVVALLREPRDELAGALTADGGPEVVLLGDALVPRTTAEAVLDGERIGRAL